MRFHWSRHASTSAAATDCVIWVSVLVSKAGMGMPATATDCSTAQLKVRNDLTLPVLDCQLYTLRLLL